MAMTPEEVERTIGRTFGSGVTGRTLTDLGQKYRSEEQLDPETMARMDSAVEKARSLRGRPLVAGMAARRMGEQGLQQQFAAMSGAPSERQHAATQQGATMGGRILGQQGQQMAGEAAARFGVGLRVAQARQQLESGQVMFALSERLKRFAASKGIQMNESQANLQAMQAAIGMVGQMTPEKPPKPGTTGYDPKTGEQWWEL